MNKNQRKYNVYEVFFRRMGEKQSRLFNSKRDANVYRDTLCRNRRKFLGMRPVTLVETD